MSKDPIESASKGATEGALEWTAAKVKSAAKQFLNRKLAFVKDAGNIDLVKKEKGSSEFSVIARFLPKGGSYEIQVELGLALRELSADQPRITDLVKRIREKYDYKGLHVVEMTEIGITAQLVTRLTKLYTDPGEVSGRLVYFLDHMEDLAIFVKAEDFATSVAKLVTRRIESFTAHMIIVVGSGYSKGVLHEALRKVGTDPRKYFIEKVESTNQLAAFIYTPELRARIAEWPDFLGEPGKRA